MPRSEDRVNGGATRSRRVTCFLTTPGTLTTRSVSTFARSASSLSDSKLISRLSSLDVQFRTATPVHVHKQRAKHSARQNGAAVDGDDDGSASSSASSSSSDDASVVQSAPYTYQSTHRTTSSLHNHHHYSGGLGPTVSAIPGYLAPRPVRTSYDHGLTVPRAPSPRRSGAEYSQRPQSVMSGRTGYQVGDAGSTHRSVYTNGRSGAGFTTAAYQPPAPAFNPRPLDFTNGPLRLPQTRPGPLSSVDAHSLSESAAQLSLADDASAGGSGYNTFLPPRTEGSLMDAGVHGMKRSWDGFKLEMKFGEHDMSVSVYIEMLTRSIDAHRHPQGSFGSSLLA